MTSPPPPPGPPRRSLRPRVPAVLRDEPQYRLLFTGQVLSILGDRVTMVVLPFAVLAVGGDVSDVAIVSAAQFLPFAILALPAGVWADRYNRKRIIITSDVTRFLCQLTAGLLLVTDTAHVTHLVVLAAVYGAADAFFAPAFTGLLPGTVSPVNLQPANALRGLSYSTGSILGPVLGGLLVALAGPGGAFLFDAATFAVSIVCLVPLRPRVVADVLHGEDPEATTTHFLTSLKEGWSEVRSRSWVTAFLGGMASYHVIVLPAIFVLGPVLAADELDGAKSWAIITAGFGLGSVLGDLLLLRWRPRFALRVASLMLIGASCQAAFIGSGLGDLGDRRARGAGRHLRHRHLHALGDVAAGARPGPGAVPRLQLRLPDQRRPHPRRQPDDRHGQRGRRGQADAVRHDGTGRHGGAGHRLASPPYAGCPAPSPSPTPPRPSPATRAGGPGRAPGRPPAGRGPMPGRPRRTGPARGTPASVRTRAATPG